MACHTHIKIEIVIGRKRGIGTFVGDVVVKGEKIKMRKVLTTKTEVLSKL